MLFIYKNDILLALKIRSYEGILSKYGVKDVD